MRKALTFSSPKEHYIADACVVWCFDARFRALLEKFIAHRRFKNVDYVIVAGGLVNLASEGGPDRDFVLNEIRKSIRLHQTKRVILMGHEGCGADGQLLSLEEKEAQGKKAAEFVGRALSKVEIETYLATFDVLNEL